MVVRGGTWWYVMVVVVRGGTGMSATAHLPTSNPVSWLWAETQRPTRARSLVTPQAHPPPLPLRSVLEVLTRMHAYLGAENRWPALRR